MLRLTKHVLGLVLVGSLMACGEYSLAQDSKKLIDGQTLSDAEFELYEVASEFSKVTLVNGSGWEGYESFLHPNFSRWSSNNAIMNKQQIVDSIRQWWETDNRTKSSQEELISIKICGDTGIMRKSVREKYVDGKGNDAGSFSGYVTHVWQKSESKWQLLDATIQQAEIQFD